MILGLDDPLPEQVLAEINALTNIVRTYVVQL